MTTSKRVTEFPYQIVMSQTNSHNITTNQRCILHWKYTLLDNLKLLVNCDGHFKLFSDIS